VCGFGFATCSKIFPIGAVSVSVPGHCFWAFRNRLIVWPPSSWKYVLVESWTNQYLIDHGMRLLGMKLRVQLTVLLEDCAMLWVDQWKVTPY
jgi:hypothetical protein